MKFIVIEMFFLIYLLDIYIFIIRNNLIVWYMVILDGDFFLVDK